MISNSRGLWAGVCALALMGGCGGGGGGDKKSVEEVAPSVSAEPTASLVDSAGGASDLVSEAKEAASTALTVGELSVAVAQAAAATGTQSAGHMRAAAATAQLVSDSSVPCNHGGTVQRKITYNSATSVTVGDSFLFTFSNCAQLSAGSMIKSGTAEQKIERYTDDSNWAFSYTARDLILGEGSSSFGPYNFGGQMAATAGQLSWSHIIDKQTIVGDPQVSRTGSTATLADAVVRSNLGQSGFVQIRFTGWVFDTGSRRASAGRADVSGGNGHSAHISVGAGGYTVELNLNGKTSTHLVPF